MSETIELEIPARAEFLSLARLVVTAAARIDPMFGDERIDDLRLVVSEATTNAIEAHVRHTSDENVIIRCNLRDDRIEVLVRDRGGGFDPLAVGRGDDAGDPRRFEHEGGFGLPLMQSLADESEIQATNEGGTDVRLVVKARTKKDTTDN